MSIGLPAVESSLSTSADLMCAIPLSVAMALALTSSLRSPGSSPSPDRPSSLLRAATTTCSPVSADRGSRVRRRLSCVVFPHRCDRQ